MVNMCIAAVLFMLGGLVVFEAIRVWRRSRLEHVFAGNASASHPSPAGV
jgi:hypothetical protein